MSQLPERDLWKEIFMAGMVCTWMGHDYTINKLSGQLCRRCRQLRR